jgi:hypothetical protein
VVVVVTHSMPEPIVVHQMEDGRWKVSFPDGLTVLTFDDCGVALALVPPGHEVQVIPGDDP